MNSNEHSLGIFSSHRTDTSFVVESPEVNETGSLVISVELDRVNISTNGNFIFKENPEISAVVQSDQLTM